MKKIVSVLSVVLLLSQGLLASTGDSRKATSEADMTVEQQMALLDELKVRFDEANAQVAAARRSLKQGEYVQLGAVAFSVASTLGVGYGWGEKESGRNVDPNGLFDDERHDLSKMRRGSRMMKWAVGAAGAGLLGAYLAKKHVKIRKADLVILERELNQVSVQLANKKRVLQRVYAVDQFLDEEDFEGSTH